MEKIYLDNAATSWPKPEAVYRAVDYFNRNIGGNPGRGTTRFSLASTSMVLETRERLAQLFNISDPLRISFTLNITEALNVALKGSLLPGDHLIISSMEHNALARPAFSLNEHGLEITVIPCNSEGLFDIKAFVKAIKKNTKMVGLLHASNVTGTIQPIKEVGKICREHGLLFLVDSAQSAGVLPIDVFDQSIDILTFTGHKGLLGPQGTGGIYVRPSLTVRPLKEGGTGSQSQDTKQPQCMPDCLESGTLNTPGIIGLGEGVRFVLEQGIDKIRSHEQSLVGILWDNLKKMTDIKIYGPENPKDRTAVLSFNIGEMDSAHLSFLLEREFGIVTRSGLHCTPLAHQTIHTLQQGTCRLSPGFFNTEKEMETVIRAIATIAKKS
ncbi:aminotransferase class V-fold PLP-dependent enzyme [Pelosinus sp. sgz500959]|uniref:aminotransferase class V-fold PLP-dependent enzyme n=1 Tax=Pelosinus sp. sgz500959 TaxID=3242472 RepID=UPI00366FED9F